MDNEDCEQLIISVEAKLIVSISKVFGKCEKKPKMAPLF